MKRTLVFSLLSFLFFSCQNLHKGLQNDLDKGGKEILLTIAPGENNPRNSEGDFIELADGRLLFIYSRFTGSSSSDHAPAFLAGRYSSDGGKTWTGDEVIVEREGDSNVMSVSLLRLQGGEIALFYARKNSLNDCKPMMRISDDEAETWSEPIPAITDKEGYFVINNDRVVQLESGRLLMPVSLHTKTDGEWTRRGKMWSYFSDDDGRSWYLGSDVANPDGVLLQEPGVVELKNGRIMMFIRSDAGVQYQAFSNDQGETWSSAEPSNIPSPLSPASIERIPSTGDLLLVWNNTQLRKRTPFNSAISKDEGKTWGNIRTIEDDPHGWYCYTAIHFAKDGVFLGHCAGNRKEDTGLDFTNITRLDLDWIYDQEEAEGKLSTEEY